jgi:hypothetical protein
MQVICEAISRKVRLEFDYKGEHRVVEPYLHGESTAGNKALRAIQVRGQTSTGKPPKKIGRLWSVSLMTNVRLLAETFVPDDPKYNPNDKGMRSIHCRV